MHTSHATPNSCRQAAGGWPNPSSLHHFQRIDLASWVELELTPSLLLHTTRFYEIPTKNSRKAQKGRIDKQPLPTQFNTKFHNEKNLQAALPNVTPRSQEIPTN